MAKTRRQPSNEIKTLIVHRLACFDTPSQVSAAVKEAFDYDITRQNVAYYDPTTAAGTTLAKKWCDLFWKVREDFLEDSSQIAIANKNVRLKRLENMVQTLMQKKNYVVAAQLLEQGAKEVGEYYTNTRRMQHTSPDGSMSPKEGDRIDASELSDEALEEIRNARRSADPEP